MLVLVVVFAMLERWVMRPTALPTLTWEAMRLPSVFAGVLLAALSATLLFALFFPEPSSFIFPVVFAGGFAAGGLQALGCFWGWRRATQFALASGLGLLLAFGTFVCFPKFPLNQGLLSLARISLMISVGGAVYAAVTGQCLIYFASEDAAKNSLQIAGWKVNA